jgi:hypothetical protein
VTAEDVQTQRDALDSLDEARHGWPEDNPYMRAHAAAVPALDRLVSELQRLQDEAIVREREQKERLAIARRWQTTHDRGAHDYTDAGCRILAEHAFRDIAFLLDGAPSGETPE